jgi:hypothetical protein
MAQDQDNGTGGQHPDGVPRNAWNHSGSGEYDDRG